MQETKTFLHAVANLGSWNPLGVCISLANGQDAPETAQFDKNNFKHVCQIFFSTLRACALSCGISFAHKKGEGVKHAFSFE
jgi:hypothetical protein